MDILAFSLLFPLFLFLITTAATTPAAATTNDTDALILFRSQTDLHDTLFRNWTLPSNTTSVCTAAWVGIKCINGRVSALSLPSLNLRGSIDSLSSLDQLRFLDLRSNRLNGSLAAITHCRNLKLVYLSDNDFSGQIPSDITSLHRLLRLDLADNNLEGVIPSQFSKLSRLLTLRLQNNALTGTIPKGLDSLSFLKDLNLSNNQLYGSIPDDLYKRFGESNFAGNAGLCGRISPLPPCSFTDKQPGYSQTVPSNPSSLPSGKIPDGPANYSRKGLSSGAVVGIVLATTIAFLLMGTSLVVYCCGRYSRDGSSFTGSDSGKRRSSYSGGERRVYANNVNGGGGDSDGTVASDKSKLVFFDRRKQFELEELLRASAEMLGKGSLGTVYKAVLDDGGTVAVKRLKDANPCSRKEFEQYMDAIGKLKHPNIVKLRAYYYAKEEKLLVYDYMPNGSLHSLLHGNRGPGRIPLDWTTRISIVLGAARGLSRIHEEYLTSRIPHGNVRSSNILLDKNGVACISDFGLSLLLNPAHAIAKLGGYKAPEQAEIKRLSQNSDVYSFGVVLLEVLTGKAPVQYPSPSRNSRSRPSIDEDEQSVDLAKWVRSVVRDEWTAEVFDHELLRYKNIEEELVSMLQVAMACVFPQPDKRPSMDEVAKMIEEIRVEQSPLGEDYDESRNSISPSIATTTDD